MNKFVMGLAILVGVGLMFGINMIFADDCNTTTDWEYTGKIICHIMEILDNQEKIINKLDWNNCAISHKGTKYYVYEYNPNKEWGEPYTLNTANKYNELVEYCGKRP